MLPKPAESATDHISIVYKPVFAGVNVALAATVSCSPAAKVKTLEVVERTLLPEASSVTSTCIVTSCVPTPSLLKTASKA